MFKSLFNRKTTKVDVLMAGAAAVAALWKALDTYKEYKAQAENEENEK
jgi:hypothetical protein